jgi:hypothetical protein
MTVRRALAFVEKHGVVLQAARGPVPNLADFVAGERIHGSWWGHPKGQEIFRLAEAVMESGDVLVCKLLDGRVTYVHKRVWPALVRVSGRFKRSQLAKVWSEHTPSGAHATRRVPFPRWVPADVMERAKALTEEEAAQQRGIRELLDAPPHRDRPVRKRQTARAR